MNPSDRIALKAEISGLEVLLGSIKTMIGPAKDVTSTAPAALTQICSALAVQQQISQRLSKLLGSIVEKN